MIFTSPSGQIQKTHELEYHPSMKTLVALPT